MINVEFSTTLSSVGGNLHLSSYTRTRNAETGEDGIAVC